MDDTYSVFKKVIVFVESLQVADELVAEFTSPDSAHISPDQQQFDEKNIQRRVYDALNVLMTMGIILKDEKDIQWKGLPSATLDDIQELKAEGMRVRRRIARKTAYLQELQAQVTLPLLRRMTGLQNLVSRNERLYHGTNSVPAGGVALPFILVQTRPQATVEVEIQKTCKLCTLTSTGSYLFDCLSGSIHVFFLELELLLLHSDATSTPFELHDDAYVLKAMSLQEHQDSESAESMGHTDFDNGLGCNFDEDSPPLSSSFQHSPFPPHTTTSPYYPGSMPSVANRSQGMHQASKSRVNHGTFST
ncbi:unnamed protein product [Sphagnum compactum]